MSSDISRPTRAITYCSFVIDDKCVGICILSGTLDVIEASKECHRLRINPGGQLLAMSCKEIDADVSLSLFEAMWMNRERLISPEEARTLFEAKSIREQETDALR